LEFENLTLLRDEWRKWTNISDFSLDMNHWHLMLQQTRNKVISKNMTWMQKNDINKQQRPARNQELQVSLPSEHSNKALRKMLNENDLTKIRTHEIVFSRYKVERVMKGGERVGRQSTPFMNRGSRDSLLSVLGSRTMATMTATSDACTLSVHVSSCVG
jgi:uncharacterized protein YigA (DUF484 family)